VAAGVLLRTGAAVAAGVTTDELDVLAHSTYAELGAYPSTLHYMRYPKSARSERSTGPQFRRSRG
jgi:methionyl aminopeptidase